MSGTERNGGRMVAIAVVAAIVIGSLLGIAARDDADDGYLVRAVFDNGSFVIPGEDVKIAGVVVGSIHDVDLTEENQAAVVLKIDDPAFTPFRQDGECSIRLQSLIGEQFIECKPTRPLKAGAAAAPVLEKIESGRGEGQYLLPVENNVTPVAEDLLRNIPRMTQREGLRLILNEFGAGLAGRGDELRAAIRRTNPALKELDRVIKILADQDRLLARLVDESDEVLAPWAEKRREFAGFIDEAGATAAYAAEEGDNIERNFQRFPPFLRELTPAMNAFSDLSDQMTPALLSLDSKGEELSEMVQRLGPFTTAATPAVTSLGTFADRASELFPAIEPLARDLRSLGKPLRPTAKNLAKLFNSFDDTGGIEELMQLIYFYTGTVNGEDEFGHYVRSALSLNICNERSPKQEDNCAAIYRTAEDLGLSNVSSASASSSENSDDSVGAGVLRKDAERIGYDLESEHAKPLLDYLLLPETDKAQESKKDKPDAGKPAKAKKASK